MRRLKLKKGQSLTTTIIGVAIMGIVGVAAGNLAHNQWEQQNIIVANADAAALMETKVNEIRGGTKFFNTENQYDGKTFDGDETRKIVTETSYDCNASGNCDAINITVKIVDKTTSEVLMQETIKKVYTHYEEKIAFTSNGSTTIPSDTIGFTYVAEGVHGGGHGFIL